MNYVGIDISKYKHDDFILSCFGEVVNEGFSFINNAESFMELERELKLCGEGNVRIGFEATGNYGINLKLFLEKSGFEFMEINPLLVKEYIRGNTLRRKSRGSFSMDKFVTLKHLARNTVGVYDKCYGTQLETLLDLHSQIDCKIDEVENEIIRIIEDLNPPTLSVNGIGPVSAAVIVSEFGTSHVLIIRTRCFRSPDWSPDIFNLAFPNITAIWSSGDRLICAAPC